MKQVSTTAAFIKISRYLMVVATLLIQFLLPAGLFAQADSAKTAEPAPAAETEAELISPSIEFISVQKADNTIDLKAAIQAKVKGTFYKLPLLKITFVQVNDTEEKELGFLITDKYGKAIFTGQRR
jgi:hypothetical protein